MSAATEYTPELIERFYSKVSKIPTEQGCLEWMAYHNNEGYGRFSVGEKSVKAHRAAWEIVNGPIPGGMVIRHFVCNNPRCCNVEHLRLGSHADNVHDRTVSGRWKNAPNTTSPYVPVRPTDEERFYSNVSKTPTETGCLDWLGGFSHGYGRCTMAGNRLLAHRVAWTLANGPIPDGMWILHACDRPACCNPAHLRLGTPAENTHDMIDKGRNQKGETHTLAKLTEAQVFEIRSDKWAGRTLREIAAHFGISISQVSDILLRIKWTHLNPTQDALYESGQIRGERIGNAKLTEQDVIAIRSDFYKGWRHVDIARHFGISKGQVGKILARQQWSHLNATQDAPYESGPPKGERNGFAKLTEQDVIAIRSEQFTGWRQVDIARHFGISQSQVSTILLRNRWAHI